MSQLAGLLSRRGEDVTQRLLKILGETCVCHDAYGLATPDGVEHSPKPIEFTSLTSKTAIAYRLIKVSSTDNPQPISSHDFPNRIGTVAAP